MNVRKLVVTEFVTLDGVMEAPHQWSFPFWGDDIGKFKFDEHFASDALLLGRITYEGFAAAWPSRTDEQGYADRMNSLPKYVVSTTLDKVEWNNSTLIKENVAEEIAKLKQQSGQNIIIHGSGTVVRALMPLDLIDEYRLLVYPLVLGGGLRLFDDRSKANLKLVESKTFSSGAVALIYRPERKEL
jgi:dihydrofolate reductase